MSGFFTYLYAVLCCFFEDASPAAIWSGGPKYALSDLRFSSVALFALKPDILIKLFRGSSKGKS